MKWMRLVLCVVVGLTIVSCGSEPTSGPEVVPTMAPTLEPAPTEPPPTTAPADTTLDSPLDLANPASQFCEDEGYRLEIRSEVGGEVGYCLFPDGTECEEWAFYRGECEPGKDPVETEFESPIGMPNPASVFCEEQGHRLEMREEAGGTAGYCIFADGTECEEWAFFRGECAPGGSP